MLTEIIYRDNMHIVAVAQFVDIFVFHVFLSPLVIEGVSEPRGHQFYPIQ